MQRIALLAAQAATGAAQPQEAIRYGAVNSSQFINDILDKLPPRRGQVAHAQQSS
jgi:hypothetical protein